MFQTTLRYGIQEAMKGIIAPEEIKTTVGEQIYYLLKESKQEDRVADQIRQALKDPQSIIELRSGKQVQIATPEMPLREILPSETGEIEITVSRPHAGG